MIVLRGHPFEWEVAGPTAVTVGVFDGVHVGHRKVVSDLVEGARSAGLAATVVTFDPHPLRFLAPEKAPKMLTSIEQRIEQFRGLGVELVGVLYFPDIRDFAPEEFVNRVLREALQARRVVVGADFRFGRHRAGDAGLLTRMGADLGFEVAVVDLYRPGPGVVSSTSIRALLARGEVSEAAVLLGRPYQLVGRVVTGDGRGRSLGFPTANLAIEADLLVPGNGVYACRARHPEGEGLAVVNIGIRPTFAGEDRRVEAHLLDFDRDLYGADLVLTFVDRIRDERKFESIEELSLQIAEDVARARAILRADIPAG
jgi:riboflavin kinase/FMN adenylyltransferase